MKSAIKVSGVCLSVLSGFAATVLFLGASALPVQADMPNNATASAMASFSLSLDTWKMGHCEMLSKQGTYTSLSTPAGLYSNVNFNGLIGPQSLKGTTKYAQHFVWKGVPYTTGQLSVVGFAYASAIFERKDQTANADSFVYQTTNGMDIGAHAQAAALSIDTPDGQTTSYPWTFNPTSVADIIIQVTTEADVSTP